MLVCVYVRVCVLVIQTECVRSHVLKVDIKFKLTNIFIFIVLLYHMDHGCVIIESLQTHKYTSTPFRHTRVMESQRDNNAIQKG